MAQTSSSSSTEMDDDNSLKPREQEDSFQADIARARAKKNIAAQLRRNERKSAKNKKDAIVFFESPEQGSADVSEIDPVELETGEAPHAGIMAFGTTSYVLHADGTVETIRDRVWSHGSRETSFTIGLLGDIATLDGIPIVKGVNAIYGKANTGKTPVLNYVRRALKGADIKAGEPYPGYLRSTADLAGAMLGATESVICVDSLKNVTGRLSGNATSGGLSKEFFATLSDMSSFFAERGQAVFIVVNVSSQREDVINESIQALESNTVALWHMTEDGRIEWLVRSDVGKKRRTGVNTVSWEGDGVVKSLGSGAKVVDLDPLGRSHWVDGDIPVVDTALNRSLARVLRTSSLIERTK